MWWRRHSDRVVDLAFAAVLLVSAAQVLWAMAIGRPPDAWTWAGAALTVVFAGAMWWRRRFPVTIALAAIATAAVGLTSVLAVSAALFTVAVARRDRVLWIVAAVSTVVVVAMGEENPTTLPPAGIGRLILDAGLLVVLPVAAGAYVGARRDLVESLRLRAEDAETEQHLRVDGARRAERARIAREMHDVLAHRVSMVALHAGGLEVNPGAGPDEVEREAALIGEHARIALADLREILGVLRADDTAPDPDGSPQPTVAELGRLVEASRRVGQEIDLCDDLDDRPPELAGRTAYRLVQECLTNVHKHAPGAAVTVRLDGAPGRELAVEVHNDRAADARAEPAVPGSGSGLIGLGERVRLLGGKFDAGPDDRGGFAVRAALPWPS